MSDQNIALPEIPPELDAHAKAMTVEMLMLLEAARECKDEALKRRALKMVGPRWFASPTMRS
jgi:hypothetical protein